jgi:hypothetical protein
MVSGNVTATDILQDVTGEQGQAGMPAPPGFLSTDGDEISDIFAQFENVELDTGRLPGFLREYLELTGKITDAQEGARLTAILPALAVNIGNRTYINNAGNRIYPNIWSVIIGPSTTARKTTALNLARRTLSPYEETLSGQDAGQYAQQTLILTNTTGTKLINLLSQQPNRLYVHNEISGFLAEMSKLYNAGMKQTITDLYDGVSRSYFTMSRDERIENPSLSIMSASTEGWFLNLVGSSHEQMSGFTQRFLYCIVGDIDVDELDTTYREGYESSEALSQYEATYSTLRAIPGSFRLMLSEQAVHYRNSIYREKMKQALKLKNDSLLSYFSRIYDGYFFKFCIIITLMEKTEDLQQFIDYNEAELFFQKNRVTLATAEQAMYLCDYYFRNTLPLLTLMSEQGKLSNEKKFANLLKERFGGHASHSQMMQYGHFTAKDMKTIVETLLEMNVITQEAVNPGGGKKAYRYHLNPKYLR